MEGLTLSGTAIANRSRWEDEGKNAPSRSSLTKNRGQSQPTSGAVVESRAHFSCFGVVEAGDHGFSFFRRELVTRLRRHACYRLPMFCFFARQTEVRRPPSFPSQSLFRPERRSFSTHASIVIEQRGPLHQHPLPRRAFSGQISATSGHCRHSPAAETQGNALTRVGHLAWCKRRALEYVDAGDLTHAVANMASDLKTHPDTDNPALNGIAMIGMMYVTDDDRAAVQRWMNVFDDRG